MADAQQVISDDDSQSSDTKDSLDNAVIRTEDYSQMVKERDAEINTFFKPTPSTSQTIQSNGAFGLFYNLKPQIAELL